MEISNSAKTTQSVPTVFLWLFVGYTILGAVTLLFISKGDIVLYFNENYTSFLDSFFKWYTKLADGVVAILLVVVLILFVGINKGVLAGLCFVSTGLISFALKRLFFYDSFRPKSVFYAIQDQLHFVEGVSMKVDFSFPSGHTISGMAIATVFAFLIQKKAVQYTFFFFGFMIGVSRMYLFQHFFVDTYVGTLLSVTICYFIISWYTKISLSTNEKLDKGLYYLLKSK
ncbi:MAG: phosphatase PAP2 family protein [Cyclobacteriaceae bacterium]